MPEFSLPEVRLKDKLPEGLRDMRLDDIQKAIPEVHFPSFDLAADAKAAGKAAERATKAAEKAAAKAAARAARQADRASRNVRRAAAREAGKAARSVERALPRRPGPNPVPIAILFMLGGIVVGWLLATNPATSARVSAWLDDLRARLDSWRGRGTGELEDDEWETEPAALPTSAAPVGAATTYTGTLPEAGTGIAVGPGGEDPGDLPTDGLGNADPERAGVEDRA